MKRASATTLFSGSWRSSSSSSSCFFFWSCRSIYSSMVHMRTVLQLKVSPLVKSLHWHVLKTHRYLGVNSPPQKKIKNMFYIHPRKSPRLSRFHVNFWGRKNSNGRDRGDLNKVHRNFAENVCSGDLVFHSQSKGPGGCADVVAESTSFLWWYRLNQMGKSHGDPTFQRSKPKWNEDICITNVHQFLSQSKDMQSIRIQHIIYTSSLKMVCLSTFHHIFPNVWLVLLKAACKCISKISGHGNRKSRHLQFLQYGKLRQKQVAYTTGFLWSTCSMILKTKLAPYSP